MDSLFFKNTLVFLKLGDRDPRIVPFDTSNVNINVLKKPLIRL
jgi:hypothetical protein